VKNELTDKNQALSASKELEAEIAELIAQKKRIESHAFSLGKLSVQFDSSFPVEDFIDPKLQLSEIHLITDAGVNDIQLEEGVIHDPASPALDLFHVIATVPMD
jgi:hypothetical protein